MRTGFLVVTALCLSGAAFGCCAVGPRPTFFAGQNNIILWDKTRKLQHFVRQAKFESDGASLGFIAPTPRPPQLVEVKAELFNWLGKYVDSQREKGMSRSRPASGGSSGGAPIVLSVQDVAGYEATILWPTNMDGFSEWLRENEFVTTPEVDKWLEHYVRKDWVFTAFKVKRQEKGVLKTGLVRMTFATERPYNPYYVPASNIKKGSGGLSVMTISPEPLATTTKTLRAGFECPFPDHERAKIAQLFGLTPNDLPTSRMTMQMWSDHEFPRENTPDIFFDQKVSYVPSPSWFE